MLIIADLFFFFFFARSVAVVFAPMISSGIAGLPQQVCPFLYITVATLGLLLPLSCRMPKVTVAMDQFATCLSQVSSGVNPCSCCIALGSSLHVSTGSLTILY